MNRITYFDHLKAFGITLVVYEHFKGVPGWLVEWIFSFHMPLFFFATGCLTKSANLSGPWVKFVGRNARQILLPYLIFGIIGYAWWFFVGRKFGSNTNEIVAAHEPIVAFLWGSAKDMAHQPLTPSPLWFLPCLFSAKCVFGLIFRLPMIAYVAALILLSGLGIWSLQHPHLLPPFGLDSALASLPFLAAGNAWRSLGFPLPRSAPNRLLLALCGLSAGAALCWWSAQSPRAIADASAFDIRAGNFGPWFVPAYIGALATLAGLIALFQPLPANAITSRLSRDSLTILALHPIVFGAMKGACTLGLHWPINPEANYFIAPAFTLGCLLLILFIAVPILKRARLLEREKA